MSSKRLGLGRAWAVVAFGPQKGPLSLRSVSVFLLRFGLMGGHPCLTRTAGLKTILPEGFGFSSHCQNLGRNLTNFNITS